jgi:hypothetical protein
MRTKEDEVSVVIESSTEPAYSEGHRRGAPGALAAQLFWGED